MPGRFEFVQYDDTHKAKHGLFLETFAKLEAQMARELIDGSAKSLALTSLEESFMWVGKAIRDSQTTPNDQLGE